MSQLRLLQDGLRSLAESRKYYQSKFGKYLDVDYTLSARDITSIVRTLSRLILRPECSLLIAQCFPQLVLQLLTIAYERRGQGKDDVSVSEECIALGRLVKCHPDAARFATRLSKKFHFMDMSERLNVPQLSTKDRNAILEYLKSCYSFLQLSNKHFSEKHYWGELGYFLKQSHSQQVKWLVCQCLAAVTGMSNHQRRCFTLRHMPLDDHHHKCVVHYGQRPNKGDALPTARLADGELLPCIDNAVVTVGGIQLPIYNPANASDKSWFLAGNEFHLRSIALAVACGKAVCLKGPVGCGKTALVEHLASLTGRVAPHFLKVQLGDQTDSKTLLGTYQCTDVPGEFVWTAGVLTRAVVEGHWLLLEDVDSASVDVATILTALLETGALTVPGYRDSVRVAPDFQLFLTQRTLLGFTRQHSVGSSLLEKYWLQINLESLDYNQLVVLVETMFPKLRSVSTRMVDVFTTLNGCLDGPSVGRQSSTRDLIKWCSRNVHSFDVTSRESTLNIFQDALDIFCFHINNAETKVQRAVRIAACLGLTEAQAAYYCNAYKPNVSKTNSKFVTGRVESQILMNPGVGSVAKSHFSFTRPSSCLLESVAGCVSRGEPVLLVGETGTGKTATVQYLAQCTQHTLVVINMNQQSDSADLLGGYKPVDLKYVVQPIRREFETLLRRTFTVKQTAELIRNLGLLFNEHRWKALCHTMQQIHVVAFSRALKETSPEFVGLQADWKQMKDDLAKMETKLKNSSAMAFAFIEGSLVQALREGWWVLLDEINLASAETLECLSGLLEGSAGSLHMLERGDTEAVKRHENFRLFACMNPATDVGKKELPVGLRNRFTEFFVDELTERSDLMQLIGTYLRGLSLTDAKLDHLVKFYLSVRVEAKRSLSDGTGHKPHYSLRTLCRALSIAGKNKCGSTPRSLYEALCVSFLTQLDYVSHPRVEQMIAIAVLNKKEAKSILHQPIPEPPGGKSVNFEGYWVPSGSITPAASDKYILTPCVRRNLRDLARVVSIGRLPVLVQGETSVGKTSLITYLAETSGNRCVRINNHEHTDLQEYVGSYAADNHGRLVFKEGVLVEAMRKGDWIILDELNLAPSDVLEALNRVLDDNRELFIPETRETVQAHPNFMLFATQNPPGLYGGRKMLSRAFRNRFVELHFSEIPAPELETILHRRCDLPPSYCKKLVAVMTELQVRRKGSSAFAGKQGFITLRDLFRWGERYRLASRALSDRLYDWDQHVADEGYLILAGRVRKREEREVIREVLRTHMKREVDPQRLFTLSADTSPVTRAILQQVALDSHAEFRHVVWTFNMRQLAVLVGKAVEFKEPVLLVGETGCGKTTIAQLLAASRGQRLYSVNCHMHTESSDFLGGLRPVRDHGTEEQSEGRLFEWVDGPLINAMNNGDLFLADEISLADDSVLERLNSLLEPERKLLLAEKGGDDQSDDSNVVVAADSFYFIGTMNPGGDYGKKELSPALRNRFTEIWCEGCTDRSDLLSIIEHNLRPGLSLGNQRDGTSGIGRCLLDFIDWFTATDIGKRFTVSIRDILTWVNYINVVCSCVTPALTPTGVTSSQDLAFGAFGAASGSGRESRAQQSVGDAYVHGAFLTFLDSLGSGASGTDSATNLRTEALRLLLHQAGDCSSALHGNHVVKHTATHFGIPPFLVEKGPESELFPSGDKERFSFAVPTTSQNASRVLRALQLTKPILLEGSPGVGKTALVQALARSSRHQLVRINLSDQTDVCDLFGSDLPVEGGKGGQFSWRDGPFLQALRAGHWILIDEMNLASQSVLEGLNACLDHRGEVFIPELGRTFRVSAETRLFGAQNPLQQGGARRGLPKSFLNRFTQVYVDSLTANDLEFVALAMHPCIPRNVVTRMVKFNSRLTHETNDLHLWGQKGGPWELNLRDISRWCQVLAAMENPREKDFISFMIEAPEYYACGGNPGRFVGLIYADRMRTQEDKMKVREIYQEVFGPNYPLEGNAPRVLVSPQYVRIGDVTLSRDDASLSKTSGEWMETEYDLVAIHEGGQDEGDSLLEAMVSVAESIYGNVSMSAATSCMVRTRKTTLRTPRYGRQVVDRGSDMLVLRGQHHALRQLARCVAMRWLAILVGPTDSGKTSVVRVLAQLSGRPLKVLSVNSAMDTTEILGGFEQVDYSRHLEALQDSVEQCLLSLVRSTLTTKPVAMQGSATMLMERWEAYKQVVSRGQAGLSSEMKVSSTEATSHFFTTVSMLKELLDLLESMSKDDHNATVFLRDLSRRLKSLEEQVRSEGSLNAGGKFEWIDSVLVKCLKDGSWLLIDNVNLSSPAVLDRLNGLLEPDGVLTIGERGVQADGKVFTVKPHPTFRIFMTMDPKNGEISRAMRNRGVEIFLPPLLEVMDQSLDTMALLSHSGLGHQHHARLIDLHTRLSSEIQGGLGVSYLVRTAYLLNQQLSRGFPMEDIFLPTCLETYVRPNLSRLSPDIARDLFPPWADPPPAGHIAAYLRRAGDIDLRFTPTTMCVHENSQYALVKQLSALFALAIATWRREPDADTRRLATLSLMSMYETAGWRDAELADIFVNYVLKSMKVDDVSLVNLSRVLREAVVAARDPGEAEGEAGPDVDTVWDLVWLPATCEEGHQPCRKNKMRLLMLFEAKYEEVRATMNANQNVSVWKYSENVLSGLCSDALTREPVIVYASRLMKQAHDCVRVLFSSRARNRGLGDADWSLWVAAIHSLFEFVSACDRPVQQRSTGKQAVVDQDTLHALYVRFEWAAGRFTPLLCEESGGQESDEDTDQLDFVNHTAYVDLMRTVGKIKASVPTSKLPLLPIGKEVRKILGQRQPFASREEAELSAQLDSGCRLLDVWSDQHLDKKVQILLTADGDNLRRHLIVKLSHADETCHVDTTSSLLSTLLNESDASDPSSTVRILDGFSSPTLTAKQIVLSNARVQLWPLHELIALLSVQQFRVKFLKRRTVASLYDEALSLSSLLEQVPSVPAALVAKVRHFEVNVEDEMGLAPELLTAMLQHCTLSPAVCKPEFWTTWQQGKVLEQSTQDEPYALDCPLLALLVTNLVVPPSVDVATSVEPSSLATLGGHEARKKQLTAVLQLVWRNMSGFSDTATELLKLNSWNCVQNQFSQLVISITQAIYELVTSACPLGAADHDYKDEMSPIKAASGTQDEDVSEYVELLDEDVSGNPQGTVSFHKKLFEILDKYGEAFGTDGEESLSQFKRCVKSLDVKLCTLFHEAKLVDFKRTAEIGLGMKLGYLQAALFSNLGLVDPVVKIQMKLDSVDKELVEIEAALYVLKLQAQVLGVDGDPHFGHPLTGEHVKKVDDLRSQKELLEKFVAYRPQPPLFHALAKETYHYSQSLASYSVLFDLEHRLLEEIESAKNGDGSSRQHMPSVLQVAKNWQESNKAFHAKMTKQYSLYPDLVQPILAAGAQISYGLHLLTSTLRKELARRTMVVADVDISRDVINLVVFPSRSVLGLVETSTSDKLALVMERVLTPELAQLQSYRLDKAGLADVRNHVLVSGSFTPAAWRHLSLLLARVVACWQRQQQRIAEKKIEEDSMFVTRTANRCANLTDEQQAHEDMKQLFPSSLDADFGDLERYASLEANPVAPEPDVAELSLLTDDDVTEVCSLHSDLVQSVIRASWIQPHAPAKQPGLRPDFVKPFLERYATFSTLLPHVVRGCDSNSDSHLLPSLAVATWLQLQAVEGRDASETANGQPAKKQYDFYRDSNVEEVKVCVPLLENLMLRVEELLAEWPDHPTLNQMTTIVTRILHFPVLSPVSRFLSGLEILLTKVQEWESNAHAGVSLAPQMQTVTHQIIAWRKLELNVWKDLLAIAANKGKCGASKWWFHIHALVQSYVAVDEQVTTVDLIAALKRFVEESSLGEFEARLDLLFTFHCHVLLWTPTAKRDTLVSILWNLHSYYDQFSANVAASIARLRSPVEKKLRDFVKIARWNDISYWSIKETVAKTHRTLTKHVKEFENILKQPVLASLMNVATEVSVINDGLTPNRELRNHHKKSYLEPSLYIASPSKECFSTVLECESDLLSRVETFFLKSRKLCKDTILATSYPNLILTVDSLVGNIVDTSNHLKNLEVSKELSKEKQKSQAKSFLQQKRKSLADLFKTLSTLGLSYKLGLAEWATDASVMDWTAPPVDVRAALQQLKTRRADHQLLSAWDGCTDYHLKAAARTHLLHNALQTPAPDLGPPNIERMRGFAVNLMRLAHKQKLEVTKSNNHLFELRCHISQLQALDDGDESTPPQDMLHEALARLDAAMVDTVLGLEQFALVLAACPAAALSTEDLEFPVPLLSSPTPAPRIVSAVKGDAVWSDANNRVRNLVASASKIKSGLDKITAQNCANLRRLDARRNGQPFDLKDSRLISLSQSNVIENGFEQLNGMADDVVGLIGLLEEKVALDAQGRQVAIKNPMAYDLHRLGLFLRDTAKSWNDVTRKDAMDVDGETPGVDVDGFKQEAERLLQKVLFVVQELYKRHTEPDVVAEAQAVPKEKEAEGEEEEENPIQDKHLKDKIHDALLKDVTQLHMDDINRMVHGLLKTLAQYLCDKSAAKEANICKRLLLRCTPCLEQLTLLAEFFITQQVAAYRASGKLLSVLLSLFINLSTKGFCVPPELAPKDKDGVDQSAGGMGLGEGEGDKDVSERIESEDQLEDARPQGEERKEEEKDCQEEDKGIEMSEDFGGKTQDLAEKEKEDDDDEDEDKEEPDDKEMGETGDGADKLDQEIWGDDEEQDDEEEEGDGKENDGQEKGEGEKDGDPELGAKDDQAAPGAEEEEQADGDQQDEEKKKKNKEINEMEEPEQDDDHVDPHHGNHPPELEPEDFDLPDDLQLDDGEAKDGDEGEENPFDIDDMKEQMPPDVEEPDAEPTEKPEEDSKMEDSSDEEDGNLEKKDHEPMETEDGDEGEKEEEEKPQEESGGKMGEEEAGEEEERAEEDKAKASDDQAAMDAVQPAEDMEVEGSKDQVSVESAQEQPGTTEAPENASEGSKDEKERVGQAQIQDSDSGHQGEMQSTRDSISNAGQKESRQEKKRKPGKSDSARTLGDVKEPVQKKLKTMDRHQEPSGDQDDEEEGDKPEERGEKGDLFQHVKDAKESYDVQTLDAATQEQTEKQTVPNEPDEKASELSDDDVEMQEDDPPPADDSVANETADKLDGDSQRPKKDKSLATGDAEEGNLEVEVEGETVATMDVERGKESTHHTVFGEIAPSYEPVEHNAEESLREMRGELERQLANWSQAPPSAEAAKAWELFSTVTADLARNLSEQLRLVLEPTQASRLRGDYRTGRRINMRKVIPYIASHFRKDKIWLRRTKPSKREYQIVLAIDDSSSMADNHSKELAFESLAVVSKALTLLEAGQLAVVSFGETPKVLHQLGEPFTEQSGASLLQQFTFEQKQTRVGQLVDFTSSLFAACSTGRSVERSQLLVIVSDGRGVYSEGPDKVRQAVRQAKLAGLFIVFIIVDNPDTKDSILDIRVPSFQDGKVSITNYLDGFPFPFYLILRDINALPAVLSEALRQWFELVTNMDTK